MALIKIGMCLYQFLIALNLYVYGLINNQRCYVTSFNLFHVSKTRLILIQSLIRKIENLLLLYNFFILVFANIDWKNHLL